MSIDTTVNTIGGGPGPADVAVGEAPTTARQNAARWRVPLILVPLFILAVPEWWLRQLLARGRLYRFSRWVTRPLTVSKAILPSPSAGIVMMTSASRPEATSARLSGFTRNACKSSRVTQ